MTLLGRAPFQVLAIPFRFTDARSIEYCLFLRTVENYWQGIAGGGEGDEKPIDAARREFREESGVSDEHIRIVALDSSTTIPVVNVRGFEWGSDCLVIPEHAFGIEISNQTILLSHEHNLYQWCNYDTAFSLLKWDSNRSALWELNHRLNA